MSSDRVNRSGSPGVEEMSASSPVFKKRVHMTPTRVRRAILGCAAVTLAAAMGAGVVPAAVASVPTPTVRDTDGPVPTHGVPTGYVRDAAGTSHVVVVRNDGVQYLTRRHGRTSWTSRHIPGSARSGLTTAALTLSTDRRHEFLVVLIGRRLYLVEKRTTAANFPRITAATKIATVHTAVPFAAVPAVTALPHGRVAVLARSKTELKVIVARPGHSLSSTRLAVDVDLPTAATATGGIARDPQTGDIIAVGNVEGSANRPIAAWMWPSGGFPSDAGGVGDGHPPFEPGKDPSQVVTAVTILNGKAWVATTRSTASGPTVHTGVFLASCILTKRPHDIPEPQCMRGRRLPHTDRRASHLLLVADPQRHQLQAVFEQSGAGHGLMHEVHRGNGTWSSPTRVTKGRDDQPLFLVGTTDHGFRYLFERKG
jgi:hypothetical protein